MPCVNPLYICQPCSRGQHAWCTMENECTCPNTWDGEGWRENIAHEAAKRNVRRLTTPAQGPRIIPESGPLLGPGRVVWVCDDCGFKSPWWRGCERFRYCTDCERVHSEIKRRQLAIWVKEQGAATNGMTLAAGREAGQGAQASLPLAAHRDGRCTDSPCDKKEPSSA
jgi:hypothetical protein